MRVFLDCQVANGNGSSYAPYILLALKVFSTERFLGLYRGRRLVVGIRGIRGLLHRRHGHLFFEIVRAAAALHDDRRARGELFTRRLSSARSVLAEWAGVHWGGRNFFSTLESPCFHA